MVELGYIEKIDRNLQWKIAASHLFPSKIGGKPSWLSLTLPNYQLLHCKVCKEPLQFLLQLYAPGSSPLSFHRTLFVFVCLNGKCNDQKGSVCVLRSQLSRANKFYSASPPNYESTDDNTKPECDTEFTRLLCSVCSKVSIEKFKCPKDNIGFCSSAHLMLHYDKNNSCRSSSNDYSSNLFTEYGIVTEPEDLSGPSDRDSDLDGAAYLLAHGLTLDAPASNETDEDIGNSVKEDKTFEKFKKLIAQNPQQVLRYERGGNALLSCEYPDIVKDIKRCERCKAPRTFEFQILPHLLNHLGSNFLDKDGVDWANILVYTCSKDCDIGTNYQPEIALRQMFSLNQDDPEPTDDKKKRF